MPPRTPRTLALAVVLLLGGCATLTPPTPESRQVDELKLEGAQVLPEKDVKERIVTTESSCWPHWMPALGRVEWFDDTAWQADLRRIRRYYEARGYYQARVLEDQVTEPKPGHVSLLVKLKEGLPARLEALAIDGLDALEPAHRAVVLAGLPLREGDIFLEDAWQRSKALVLSHLRQLGYAEALVVGEATVDVDAPSVRARLDVKPGRRFKIGRILAPVDTRAQVSGKLIREQVEDAVHPGDWFSESALAEAQARVFQMGVFGAVKVNRGAPEDDGTIPIVVDTREAPFRSLRLGGGVLVDNARNDVHLLVEHTNRNLGFTRLFNQDSRLDKMTLKAKVGWVFIPNFVAVLAGNSAAQQGPVATAQAEYEVPRIFNVKTLALQTQVAFSRVLEPAYSYLGAEAKVGLVWRPAIDLTVVPSLNLNIYGVSSELSPGSNAPTAAIGCPKFPRSCLITYAALNVEWDRRDNRLEPREGTYLSLDLQGGLSQTERLTPFARVAPELRAYTSFGRGKRLTIAGKLRAGTLLAPGNDTPIIARFFSGGSSMRGFNQRRLSPMAAVPLVDATTKQPVPTTDPSGNAAYLGTGLPIGGSGLLEAAGEVRWVVAEDWSVAAFSDAGLVTWAPLALTADTLQSLYVAVGLGFRYQSPVGPLRFDVSYRLPLGHPQTIFQPTTQTVGAQGPLDVAVPVSEGCFGLGGSGTTTYPGAPEGRCTWHLSIGEAF